MPTITVPIPNLHILLALIAGLIMAVRGWLQQGQTVDTSVLIAIITSVVGLLTLLIQSWLALEMAKLKAGQKDQAGATQVQTAKLDEVHTVVNGGQTKLLAELAALRTENALLMGANTERLRNEAKAVSFEAGRQSGALGAPAPAPESRTPPA